MHIVRTQTPAAAKKQRQALRATSRGLSKRVKCFIRLAAVTALLFLLAGAALFYSLMHVAAQTAPPPGSVAAVLPPAHSGFYFRNRLWLADAKTFAHMMSYLLSPELPAKTNLVVNG